MMDQMAKILEPIRRRIMGMVARGIIQVVDDTQKVQRAQATFFAGETFDGLDRLQNYGFYSNPKSGSECVGLFMGGNRDHGVIIVAGDRKVRIQNLASGEVAIADDQGNLIKLKQSGELDVTGAAKVVVTAPEVDIVASSKVQITSPTVTMSGDLQVTGKVQAGGDVIAGGNVSATGNVSGAAVSGSGAVSGASGTFGGVSIATIKTDFNTHTHTAPSGGGATSSPSPTIP